MSFGPRDIDDIPTLELVAMVNRELGVRASRTASHKCGYCGQPIASHTCRYAGKHTPPFHDGKVYRVQETKE